MQPFDCSIELAMPGGLEMPPIPAGSTAQQQEKRPAGACENRWNEGAWVFRDETLGALEVLLDEAFRIPGTSFRFGIDGIIGLAPGLGDVVAGLLSLVIPLAAWVRGAPYVTLARMVVNLAVGVLVGSVPVLGDIFDVVWKANRRNYRLLQLHLSQPRRRVWRDWAFLVLMALLIGVTFAIPVVGLIWVAKVLIYR